MASDDLPASSHLLLRSRNEMFALLLPWRAVLVALVLVMLLVAISALSMTIGSFDVSLSDLVATLSGHTISKPIDNVVWQFRFPRTIAAALVGAMMALSGGALQSVTRNGLADPSLVGISQGAALAAVAMIIAFPDLNLAWMPLLAFFGALFTAGCVQALAFKKRGNSAIRFILIGIGVSAFISSITSVLLTYGDIDRAMSALAWLSGSVNTATWSDVHILLLWLVCLSPFLFGLSRVMSVLRMGADTAVGLGAPITMTRLCLTGVAVGFAAAATSLVGPLGFVGLIAPHSARYLARAGVGMHLLITALCGALTVSIADLLGRALFAPVQLPAGLVTAVIGVPFFIFLLHRSAQRTTL